MNSAINNFKISFAFYSGCKAKLYLIKKSHIYLFWIKRSLTSSSGVHAYNVLCSSPPACAHITSCVLRGAHVWACSQVGLCVSIDMHSAAWPRPPLSLTGFDWQPMAAVLISVPAFYFTLMEGVHKHFKKKFPFWYFVFSRRCGWNRMSFLTHLMIRNANIL